VISAGFDGLYVMHMTVPAGRSDGLDDHQRCPIRERKPGTLSVVSSDATQRAPNTSDLASWQENVYDF
jgi:hypothetical protein